jgi:hypothetical protein
MVAYTLALWEFHQTDKTGFSCTQKVGYCIPMAEGVYGT